jgi:hypothetical protein
MWWNEIIMPDVKIVLCLLLIPIVMYVSGRFFGLGIRQSLTITKVKEKH